MKNHRLHRFQRQITQIILPVTCYLVLVTNSYAAGISSDELIRNAKEYDGKEVVFQGEVIGDIMKRGDFCWMNISDGKNTLGIFLKKSLVDNVASTGGYNHVGDIVEAKGIFHRACLEHGGDLDMHVSKIIKLKDGYKVIRKMDQKKIRVVLWLAGILFVLIITAIYRYNVAI
jgi:hypothetical protein